MNIALKSTISQIARLRPAKYSRLTRAFSTTIAKSDNKQSKTDDPPVNNEPIHFFGSKAAAWKAKESRSGGADESLWFQPYVVSGSLAVFLLYFCVLREENDIDIKLGRNLFEQVEGLEAAQLVINYKYNKENGIDNTAIEARLKELNLDIKKISE